MCQIAGEFSRSRKEIEAFKIFVKRGGKLYSPLYNDGPVGGPFKRGVWIEDRGYKGKRGRYDPVPTHGFHAYATRRMAEVMKHTITYDSAAVILPVRLCYTKDNGETFLARRMFIPRSPRKKEK